MLRPGLIIAFLTMISRVLGLVREMLIASVFGASSVADCVNVAFKFPNLFRRIFGEGALSLVFVPIYSKKLLESKILANEFCSKIFTLLLISLTILMIICELSMPYLMLILAPGFEYGSEKFTLAVTLCRITTPYLILISTVALFGGVMNSAKRFAAFAATPIISNVATISLYFVFKQNISSEYSISFTLVIGGVMQVLFMIFAMKSAGLQIKITKKSFNYEDKDVKLMLQNMIPATLSSGVQQLNIFISQSIASFIPGAVSILSYADRLYQLPLAIIGISFGTVLLPSLSEFYKTQNFKAANNLQNKALTLSMFLTLPSMLGLIATSKYLVHLIYEHGEFTQQNTYNVSLVLIAFSFGLPAFVISKILLPMFYANHDNKTPFRITCYTIILNLILNMIFMLIYGYVGIAIGSSIAAWYNCFLLAKHSRKYGDFVIFAETKRNLIKISASTSIMYLILYIGSCQWFDEWFFTQVFIFKIISLAIVIFSSVLFYLGLNYLLKTRLLLSKNL